MNTMSIMKIDNAYQKLEKIKSYIGCPAFEGEGVSIFHGDCLQLIKELPDGLIDLTVTSPPYNIGKEYEEIQDLGTYLQWCWSWISEIYRITKDNGSFWLNLGYLELPERAKAIPIPYLLWDKIRFYLIQEVVWNYGAGVACRTRFSPRNEKFLWYVKDKDNYVFNLDDVRDPDVKYPNQKKNGKLKCNPLGKNPSDVWQIPKVTSGESRSSSERTPHPAQFPVALIERIIKSSSNPGDIIFDPFMGSGSTAEAAINAGRLAIGFELDKTYIEYASKRIDNYFIERNVKRAQQQLSF